LAHESLLSGPNQAGGKTTALCVVLAAHMTGRYPEWWTGVRFDRAVNCAIGGQKGATTRDLLTNDLLGPKGDRGCGIIPAECSTEEDITYLAGGVANQIDFFRVQHVTGGWSTCYVFSYASGWKKLQGYTLDVVGIDEEPDYPVYSELSARLNFTRGYIYLAMTPNMGPTKLIKEFEDEVGGKILIPYTIDDCQHISKEHIESLYAKYPEGHPEREARLFGRPVRGEGLIFHMPDVEIITDVETFPEGWPRIIGLDFPHTPVGTFAAAKLTIDTENDIVYLISEYKGSKQNEAVYADRVRTMGGAITPVAWPHDGNRAGHDGRPIARKYKDFGLNMLPKPANSQGLDTRRSSNTWPTIMEIADMMVCGQFKVTPFCTKFLDEKAGYYTRDGKLPKGQENHIIDAVVKAMMMRRYAGMGRDTSREETFTSLEHMFSSNIDFYSDFGR